MAGNVQYPPGPAGNCGSGQKYAQKTLENKAKKVHFEA